MPNSDTDCDQNLLFVIPPGKFLKCGKNLKKHSLSQPHTLRVDLMVTSMTSTVPPVSEGGEALIGVAVRVAARRRRGTGNEAGEAGNGSG